MRPPTSRLPKLGRALAVAALVFGLTAAPAAAAGLSPDAGNSDGADSIRTAYWVMFVVAFVIGVPLLGGLFVAVRRFRAKDGAEPRRLIAGRGVIARVGAGLGVVALAIFVFGIVMTEEARDASAEESGEPLEITVVGQQWLWRFEYPRSQETTASPGISDVFTYNELVVPVDTTVNLSIDSTDVLHQWFIPALGGQVEAVPGEVSETSFRADEEGVYPGQSTEFSGTSFPAMRAWVRVVSQDDYDQFIEQLTADLGEAQSEVQAAVAEEAGP